MSRKRPNVKVESNGRDYWKWRTRPFEPALLDTVATRTRVSRLSWFSGSTSQLCSATHTKGEGGG
jgi:hypothetical protein